MTGGGVFETSVWKTDFVKFERRFAACWPAAGWSLAGRERLLASARLAGELGIEPRLTESESVVLPIKLFPNIADVHGLSRVLHVLMESATSW